MVLRMYVCMYICMYIRIHTYVCMYVCMYMCMYVCVYVYCIQTRSTVATHLQVSIEPYDGGGNKCQAYEVTKRKPEPKLTEN